MNERQLPLLIYAAMSALTFAQDKPAAEPPQLVAAREENIRATQRALAPVLQNYVAKLTALKQQLTREGKLEAGVAVDKELREATQQLQDARNLSDPTKPISAQLTIVSAVYGETNGKRTVNVSRIVREAILAGKAGIRVTNDEFNNGRDPAPYAAKDLKITYMIGGAKREKSFAEKAMVDFKNDLK